MSRLPEEAIGRAYQSKQGWQLLDTLVDLDRMAGHEGESEAAMALADGLEHAGARERRVEPFSITGWWRDHATIKADNRVFDEPHEVVALPNSPSGEVTGRVADTGYGMSEDFNASGITDAVVLATRGGPANQPWPARWEKYARTVDGGGRAFVLGSNRGGCLPPTGHIGAPNNWPASIPAVGVSREVMSWIRQRELDSVSVSIAAESRSTESQNVEAVIGPDTNDEILVTAHFDAHDIGDGAADNGLGCATLVEIAATLAPVEDVLDTRVRFVGFGAEEIGIQGSEQWATTHDLSRTKAVVNVDTAGTGRTLKLKTMGFSSIEEQVSEAAESLAVPVEFKRDLIPDSDHWPFVCRGVPAVTANSVQDEKGRGWGHTHGDTLDKLDRRDLRETAIVLSAGIVRLAANDTEIPTKDRAEIKRMVPEHHQQGLKASGRWPF
jgi:Iap family predicted aminopeptidase